MTMVGRQENGGVEHSYDEYGREWPSRIEDSAGVFSQPQRPRGWWMDSRIWSLWILAAILVRAIFVLVHH
jgi:hypothetical protein